MIIDIIVILKLYLICIFNRITGVTVFGNHVSIQTPNLTIAKLYINEPIR